MSVETVQRPSGEFIQEVDVQPDQPTRSAAVKWVVVVDETLNPGLIANATACMAAAVGNAMPRLLGDGGDDASGGSHVGLPWLGCSVLAADATKIQQIRAKAAASGNIFIADMVDSAQKATVYTEYLEVLARTPAEELAYYAVSLVGPRKRIDKLVGKLSLLR
ncbi:DUF2000 domain-containing protein [Streptomyces sp. NPDC049687]|uniref:DUF2000 domain-containing protein n=1 Tax=Streptomyces sp. NPDC049687 TaxID=3365596 RepID=UPI0037A2AC80